MYLSEERLARLEGRVEEVSKQIDDLRKDMNHRFEELREDRSKHIDKVWKTSLLSLGGTFTILAAVIGILLKLLLG